MLAFTLALLILGEAPPAAPELAGRVAPGIDGAVELVLIGDTGEPGPLVARWSRALAKEPAQAIVVLGDLVYPQAPPCRAGVPDLAARRNSRQPCRGAVRGDRQGGLPGARQPRHLVGPG